MKKTPVVENVTSTCLGFPADDAACLGAASNADDDVKVTLSSPGKAKALLKALPELLDDVACEELMMSLLSHSNEAIRMAVHAASQQTSGSPTVHAQEPSSDVDQARALEVADLQESNLTPAPASSSSLDRLAFMLNQVPIEVPTQTPTQPTEAIAEGKDAHLVAPTDDTETDVNVDEESEDVGIDGPEQVTDVTGHSPNAIGTRTDAGEDWCLL